MHFVTLFAYSPTQFASSVRVVAQMWDATVDSVTKEMVDELGFGGINVKVNNNAR